MDYSIVSGRFYWRVRAGRQAAGTRAGNLRVDGYIFIKIDGHGVLAHRLAPFWLTGEWPNEQIDHVHGLKAFNGWFGLREASNQINSQNLHSARRSNKTGFLGVSPSCQRAGRFVAQIRRGKQSVWLGEFDNAEAAHAAYLAAKRVLHPEAFIHRGAA